jgi:hypothetical protein
MLRQLLLQRLDCGGGIVNDSLNMASIVALAVWAKTVAVLARIALFR